MTKPWPGMLRGIWGDEERFVETYWERVPGKYLAGDNARQDEDGYWIKGRTMMCLMLPDIGFQQLK